MEELGWILAGLELLVIVALVVFNKWQAEDHSGVRLSLKEIKQENARYRADLRECEELLDGDPEVREVRRTISVRLLER